MLARAPYLLSLLLIFLLAPFLFADSIPASAISHSIQNYPIASASAVSALQKDSSADLAMTTSFVRNDGAAPVGFRVANFKANGPASFSQSPAFSPTQFGNRHGTISYPIAGWRIWREQPMAAPEPTSLLLLSTGLLAIAGLVRRTLKSQVLKTRASESNAQAANLAA